MANWKEIAFKTDVNALGLQTSDSPTEGQVAIGHSTAGELQYSDLGSNKLLVGDSSDNAQIVGTTGDVTISSNNGSNATFTIGATKVTTGMIANDSVTYGKFEQGTAGSLATFGTSSSSTNADVDLRELTAGANGQVLKTIIANGKTYTAWGDPSSTSTVDVADGGNQTQPLPVNFSASADGTEAAIYGDEGRFTYDQDAEGGTLAVPVVTATTFNGTFNGNASTSSAVTTAVTANASASIAMLDSAGGSAQVVKSHAGITFDATDSGGKLTVANLEVTGTTTTVNSEDLVIQDNTITLAVPATAASGTIALGSASGLIISTNGLGGDGDDDSSDVSWNPRFMWHNSGTTVDGASGITTDAGTGIPASTTLGWTIAGRGAGVSGKSTAVSTSYNLAPMVMFGGGYAGSGGASGIPTEDIGIGAQYLTNEGNNGTASRLFIQVK